MKISILGVPSSIGARSTGTEKGPAALRRAGLAEKILSGGHDLEDRGDQEEILFTPDPDPARRKTQNLPGVAAMARVLADRVESVLRDGRKLLVLGGDCTVALGSVAGISRVHPGAGLAYLDRDAELNTPASTPSGILDGMVISHLLGRGAPELARIEPVFPLVRPGRLALLGIERLDPQEVPVFMALPSLRVRGHEIRRDGAAVIARETLRRVAGGEGLFYVHLDVDVIDSGEMPAVDFPARGGISGEDARDLLSGLAAGPGFLGIEVTNLNPDRDPGGAAAARVVEILGAALDAAPRIA
jgi:arginase